MAELTSGAGNFQIKEMIMQTSQKQSKRSLALCFLTGVLLMLGINTLRGADAPTTQPPPSHVYDLRMYHAKEGKLTALKARFADHTDAIFKRHNLKSVGYW